MKSSENLPVAISDMGASNRYLHVSGFDASRWGSGFMGSRFCDLRCWVSVAIRKSRMS